MRLRSLVGIPPGWPGPEGGADEREPGDSAFPWRGVARAPGCGIAAIIGGVLAVLAEAGDHAACGSGLVQAASPGVCGTADTVWTAGVVGIALGAVLLLGTLTVRSRQ
ncbi:MAG: hypothetical protein JO345_34475 [Streptosporangiaceae bacterium]|nr:hypothetical protein [Streptosporangiaceae bacterium]